MRQQASADKQPIDARLYLTEEELAYLDAVAGDNRMSRNALIASMVREVIYDDIAEEKKGAQ